MLSLNLQGCGLESAARPHRGRLRAAMSELMGIVRIAGDLRSFVRLVTDVVVRPRATRTLVSWRVLAIAGAGWSGRERRVRLKEEVELTYRLNPGDILALRETWIDNIYRLPVDAPPQNILDLGANIGLTSVWLAHTYGPAAVVAVEPLPANVRLLRTNLTRNRITAKVVQAAVGPTNGTAWFVPSAHNTEGRVADEYGTPGGIPVRMVTIGRLLELLEAGSCVDVLKLDIEGGERALLLGDRQWLERVRAMIVEFHPWMVDCAGLAQLIAAEGFRHLPADSVRPGSMDAFVREA